MSDHAVLDPQAHRDLRIRTERDAALGDAVMSALLMPEEFRRAQNSYPIVFRKNIERDSFVALALLGFENGENLYLVDGRWDAPYRPLSIDIQPFLIGLTGGTGENAGAPQVHIDLASPRIVRDGSAGERVFGDDARPTAYLETIIDRLGALHSGYQALPDFFTALDDYDLLEPFAFDVTLNNGASHRLVGFHTINEERLHALDGDALGKLHATGHLLPIFMALASLSNLPRLIARKNARIGHG